LKGLAFIRKLPSSWDDTKSIFGAFRECLELPPFKENLKHLEGLDLNGKQITPEEKVHQALIGPSVWDRDNELEPWCSPRASFAKREEEGDWVPHHQSSYEYFEYNPA
jgi:hypothetical protein